MKESETEWKCQKEQGMQEENMRMLQKAITFKEIDR